MLFDIFELTDYTFLQLESGAGGNKVVASTDTTGVFEGQAGLVQSGNAEAYAGQSVMHIRPDEPFVSLLGGFRGLVGHGIRVGNDDYRIEGVTVGTDFDEGSIEFYRATLKKESLWASTLPLE